MGSIKQSFKASWARLEAVLEQELVAVSVATMDTATDYTTNKKPLPMAATAHPMRTMVVRGCPIMLGGRG